MSKTTVLINYRAQPDHIEDVRTAIHTLISTVQTLERECGGITMLQDQSDPTRFALVEHWPSRELFLGPHMQQPHIQSFIKSAGAFLSGPPDISFWNEVSSPGA